MFTTSLVAARRALREKAEASFRTQNFGVRELALAFQLRCDSTTSGGSFVDVTVAMRAHRKLSGLARYRSCHDSRGISATDVRGSKLAPDETLLGVYENPADLHDGDVLITDRGLYILERAESRFLPFEEMISAELNGGEKSPSVDRIAIHLRDGSTALVPILGGDPSLGTRDAFAVLMFLEHVIEDQNKHRNRRSSVSDDVGEPVQSLRGH